jgi:hypothetical protein
MYDFYLLMILTGLLIYSFYIDVTGKYKKCIQKYYSIIPIILFHRILTIFMFTGWLFKNPVVLVLYLIVGVLLMLHWYTNDNKCFITQIENRLCEFPPNTPYNPIYYYLSNLEPALIDLILLLIISLFSTISFIRLIR